MSVISLAMLLLEKMRALMTPRGVVLARRAADNRVF